MEKDLLLVAIYVLPTTVALALIVWALHAAAGPADEAAYARLLTSTALAFGLTPRPMTRDERDRYRTLPRDSGLRLADRGRPSTVIVLEGVVSERPVSLWLSLTRGDVERSSGRRSSATVWKTWVGARYAEREPRSAHGLDRGASIMQRESALLADPEVRRCLDGLDGFTLTLEADRVCLSRVGRDLNEDRIHAALRAVAELSMRLPTV